MDKAKFKELVEKGFISVEPPEVWLPMQTKDGVWKNHYAGQQGHILHLSGGWMINEETGELRQIEQSPQTPDKKVDEELIERAKKVIKESGRTYLQGPLKISYVQQVRILDELERRGLIGPANGSQPREINF